MNSNLLLFSAADGEYWRILNALLLPENQGCRILRRMLESPDFFEVRDGLPQCVISSFFHVIWNKYRLEGKKLRIVKLATVPTSLSGVLHVKAASACREKGLVPLLKVGRDNSKRWFL